MNNVHVLLHCIVSRALHSFRACHSAPHSALTRSPTLCHGCIPSLQGVTFYASCFFLNLQ